MRRRRTRREALQLLAVSALLAGASGIDPSVLSGAAAQGDSSEDDSLPQGSAPAPTLRGAADSKGFEIGCAILHWYAPGMLDTYAREFNLAIVGWDMNWSNLEPTRGNLTFSNPSQYADADARVQFALENNMKVRGEDLVYAPFYPDWLVTGAFSRSELTDIVQNHIYDVVTHFSGKISQWVVLNEYLPLSWHSRPDILHEVIGDELVEIVFQAARSADPSAVLLYNDGGNERPNGAKVPTTKDIVAKLKPKGLIDAVGLQMHLDGANPPSKTEVIEAMRGYGLPAYVTGSDINLRNVPGSNDERFAIQAQIWREVLDAALASGVCNSFSFYGIGDKYSWLEFGGPGPLVPDYSAIANPTPFDDDLNPKPAYYALLDVLRNTPIASSPPPVPELPPGLRQVADPKGIEIGSAIQHTYAPHMLESYAHEFNLASLDWDLMWRNIEPMRGHVVFTDPNRYQDADGLVQFALDNHMTVRGQSLLWSQGYPDWLRDGTLARSELIDIMRRHITEVMTHFKGKVRQWVVLNEFNPLRWHLPIHDKLLEVVGDDYVQIAFESAREADPAAILLYNEPYNGSKFSDELLRVTQDILGRLKPKDLIDGVGVQMHLDGAHPPTKSEVIQRMRSFGLPVYVTEFDVNLKDVSGTTEERFARQAEIYRDMFAGALESGVCRSVTVFGIGDKYSWLQFRSDNPLPDAQTYLETWNSPNANPTPFDDDLAPKPAYYALQQVLQGAHLAGAV